MQSRDAGWGQGDQRPCIQTCVSTVAACGYTKQTVNGKKVGQIDQAINALIHATSDGPCSSNCPQDTINTTTGPPFPITAGSANPYGLAGKSITSSDSLVTVPLYDGSALTPGGSTVTLYGFMQMFIQDANHQGQDDFIDSVILGLAGCGNRTGTCGSGGNGGGGTNSTEGGGQSLFPIRLVRTPGT